MALYFADEAVIVTNPEVSSVRDSDRILGVIQAKSYRAEHNLEPVRERLLITRYDYDRVERGEMLKVEDVLEILAIPLLGVIPESPAVLRASNVGMPVVLGAKSNASLAYADAVARFLGDSVEHRFLKAERRGLFDRLLRRTA
jgi:septum site-determining protein MinD